MLMGLQAGFLATGFFPRCWVGAGKPISQVHAALERDYQTARADVRANHRPLGGPLLPVVDEGLGGGRFPGVRAKN